MKTGKIKDKFGTEYTFELIPNKRLVVKCIYLGVNKEFDAEGITSYGQVIHLIDCELTDVIEWQIENGPWVEY
jgi:hypothetical protein